MELTLEQKAALLQGRTVWATHSFGDIPSIFLADGPHGLRKQTGSADHLGLGASLPATCFPTAATMANSWDPALMERMGRALGAEAAAMDVHVLLGPGMNLKRGPFCGRNFEYFSEDPCLTGKMAAACIRGIQAAGVAACPKHFAVNSQELRRMTTDSVVDERTLRELYLTAFEIAVKEAAPLAIMTSYNPINGTYANENRRLLTDILRGEWGFDGFVVSDWGADHDHIAGIQAGSDLVMPAPGYHLAASLVEAVKMGRLSEADLEACVQRLSRVAKKVHAAVAAAPKQIDREAHHALAKECAASAIVLLENDGSLPLEAGVKTAVIGAFACQPRYQGAGSSIVEPTRLDTLTASLQNLGLNLSGFAPGYSLTDPRPNAALIAEAVALAKTADAVLLCVGLDGMAESEGLDRSTLALSPGQQKLIEEVCRANSKVIAVLSGGAPFLLPPCSYAAVIHGYLGGQAGAAAMAEALLGITNPGGRLAETWYGDDSGLPRPSDTDRAVYTEGLSVGYRSEKTPRYPFGYGLSYTAFRVEGMTATLEAVCVQVTNTGSRAGAYVAQVYVSCRGQVSRPREELKAFQKVYLEPGESKAITIALDERAFRYFNTATGRFEIEPGTYTLRVEDQRVQLEHPGTAAPLPAPPAGDAPPSAPPTSGRLTREDTFSRLRQVRSVPAWLFVHILDAMERKSAKQGKPDLTVHFIWNMPLRAAGRLTKGIVSDRMTDDLALLLGGHFFRGSWRFLKHYIQNRRISRRFKEKLYEQNRTDGTA